jgi:predicted flavoprotein YhiN
VACIIVREILAGQVNFDQKTSEVSRQVRQSIVKSLKSTELHLVGLMGLDKAVVVDGGISLNEVDTKSFRSKVIKNLFVTGDLLDINRPSGGYSLQLCWTSGYLAGEAAAKDSTNQQN